jgi:hypothetical protein
MTIIIVSDTAINKLSTAIAQHTAAMDRNTAANDALTNAVKAGTQTLQRIASTLDLIEEILQPEAAGFNCVLTNLDGSSPVESESPMNVTLPDDAPSKILRLTPKDAKGFPTDLDGPATFTSGDETKAKATVQPDGLSAQLDWDPSVGPGDSVQIQFEGDAKMGDEVKTITGTLDVTFVAGEAATLAASLEDVPAPPAP